MTEFEEAVDALAHLVLDQTRKLGVRMLKLEPDPRTGQVHVLVTVHPNVTDEQLTQITRQLVNARTWYTEELAISYELVASDAPIVQTSAYQAPGSALTFA